MLQNLVDDFIAMNQQGKVLALCKKYYDDQVIMLNNGNVFARSMIEAHDKQKGFIDSVESFDVDLISKVISDNMVELVFHYKMTGVDSTVSEFKGKHVQTWENEKIVREEYLSVN